MSSESYILFNYSDSDDESGADDRGWVSELKEALGVRLGQLLGEEERSRGTALVAVVSPGYVEDPKNADGLRRHLEELDGGATGGRVFLVVKSPVSRDRLPRELQELPGYDFFAADPDTGKVQTLSRRSPGELSRRYWGRLTDLAADVAQALSRREVSVEDPRTVFLAETSEDLQEDRRLIYRELVQRGFQILPEGPLPSSASRARDVVREQLSRCQVSVHPVGRIYGEVPEGGDESLVALQAELALERSSAGGFSRLIWMPPGSRIEDARQERLVERLVSDPRLEAGSDFLITSLEKLKVAISRALEKTPAAEPPAENDHCQVFLICDQREVEKCRPLRGQLEDRGFGVLLPSFEGDESDVRRDHERKLVFSDAVLIHWGEASESWLQGMLLEVRKSLGLGRTKPYPETAVYLDAPETPEKTSFVAGIGRDIGQAVASVVRDLAPFLARIERLGGRA